MPVLSGAMASSLLGEAFAVIEGQVKSGTEAKFLRKHAMEAFFRDQGAGGGPLEAMETLLDEVEAVTGAKQSIGAEEVRCDGAAWTLQARRDVGPGTPGRGASRCASRRSGCWRLHV